MNCRFCRHVLEHSFADLGMQPLCQSVITEDRLGEPETFYPLHARVCGRCFLVQVDAAVPPEEIFSEYAYFSSTSDSWVEHARSFAATAVERFDLSGDSLVLEVASNDGYLLQHFQALGVPVLGVEPAANVAAAAEKKAIPSLVRFFSTALADELVGGGQQADLVVGNNVFAHVPDVNDFAAALERVLAPSGAITLEFPHLMRLIEGNQFDTIYHEHFSYFSLATARAVLKAHGLDVFDVEELPTHGGSLRLCVARMAELKEASETVGRILEDENSFGLSDLECYARFSGQVAATKRALLELLIDLRKQGRTIAGYGAAGKGNTLLNYCGIGTEFLDYTVDRNTYKQGTYLPGSRIPVRAPERVFETRPDYLLVLPWNLKEEIMSQMAGIRQWGGRFIIPIPKAEVVG